MMEWLYELAFKAPLSIFAGHTIAGLVDRTIVRNAAGLPYVPGSSVKGRWRFVVERLLRTGEGRNGLWIHGGGAPACKDRTGACTVCRLFGSPAIPSGLHVGQAELVPSLKPYFEAALRKNRNPVIHQDVEHRPGIALSRARRVVVPNHLFVDEVLPPASFCGTLMLVHDLSEVERQFLRASAALVDRIGARKSVGRGALDGGIRLLKGAA